MRRLVKEGGGKAGLPRTDELVNDGRRGHLGMLAISRHFQGDGIEDRLTAAMCDAFGVDTLDVPPRLAA